MSWRRGHIKFEKHFPLFCCPTAKGLRGLEFLAEVKLAHYFQKD